MIVLALLYSACSIYLMKTVSMSAKGWIFFAGFIIAGTAAAYTCSSACLFMISFPEE